MCDLVKLVCGEWRGNELDGWRRKKNTERGTVGDESSQIIYINMKMDYWFMYGIVYLEHTFEHETSNRLKIIDEYSMAQIYSILNFIGSHQYI